MTTLGGWMRLKCMDWFTDKQPPFLTHMSPQAFIAMFLSQNSQFNTHGFHKPTLLVKKSTQIPVKQSSKLFASQKSFKPQRLIKRNIEQKSCSHGFASTFCVNLGLHRLFCGFPKPAPQVIHINSCNIWEENKSIYLLIKVYIY